MVAERLAIVEEGCWLDRVADSRKLATFLHEEMRYY